jgi:hypothetical protein
LAEVLELARALDLGAPDDVTVLAVETADEITVGGAMHPLVAAAIPRVCVRAQELIEAWRCEPAGRSQGGDHHA